MDKFDGDPGESSTFSHVLTVNILGDDPGGFRPAENDNVIDIEGSLKTGKWPFPMATECRICRKPVRMIRHPFFCRQHWRERAKRQKRGVAGHELSTAWEDTLATWNDRPKSLRDEPAAEEFSLSWPIGDLLLFSRGYPTRLPDWIVLNLKTGSIQRFANVSREEIEEQSLGGNMAPRQEEMMKFWGTPEGGIMAEMREAMSRIFDTTGGKPCMPRLSNVVR